MKTEVHDLTIWAGRQSLNGTLIDHQHVPKLRASIERDAHDNQSHARVEAWTTERGWETIHSVPITNMAIGDHSYVERNADPDYYFTHNVNGKAGLPYWTDQMEADLAVLLDYGRAFFE